MEEVESRDPSSVGLSPIALDPGASPPSLAESLVRQELLRMQDVEKRYEQAVHLIEGMLGTRRALMPGNLNNVTGGDSLRGRQDGISSPPIAGR